MTGQEKLIAALVGLLGVGLVGGIAYAASSKGTPSSSSPAAPTGPYTFQAGHRYAIGVSASIPFGTLPTNATSQALLDASIAGGFRVISVTSTDAQHVTIIADCLRSFTSTGAIRPGGTVTLQNPGGVGTISLSVTVQDQGVSPAPPPSGAGSAWVRTQTIAPGSQVLVAMNATDLQNYGATIPGFQGGVQGFQQILTSPAFVAIMSAQQGIQFWTPGTATPDVTPPDDTNAANEYKAMFNFSGQQAVAVSILLPLLIWTRPAYSMVPGPPVTTGGSGTTTAGGYVISIQSQSTTLSVPTGQAVTLSLPNLSTPSTWYVQQVPLSGAGGSFNLMGQADAQGWVRAGSTIAANAPGNVKLNFQARSMQGAVTNSFSVMVQVS